MYNGYDDYESDIGMLSQQYEDENDNLCNDDCGESWCETCKNRPPEIVPVEYDEPALELVLDQPGDDRAREELNGRYANRC